MNKTMKTLISSVTRSRLRCGLSTLAMALCWFALSPAVKAQCPSACGSGANTAVGVSALDSVTSGINNTAVGANALTADTTGAYNVAIGSGALAKDTTGFQNMAIGAGALANNVTGNFNMGIGFRALFMNTGNRNSGVGAAALGNNTTASDNTAIGSTALANNSTGGQNTAIGSGALTANTTAGNTAIGYQALTANTTGGMASGTFLSLFSSGPNTAVGNLALGSNVDGGGNTALGYLALTSTTSGLPEAYCTAVGFEALASDTATASDDGTFNSAFGAQALLNLTTGISNTAVGALAGASLSTGSQNTFLGIEAGINVSTATGVTCLGEHVFGKNVTNTTFVAHVRGVATQNADAVNVVIDSDGQLGTVSSSRRFKHDIKPMGETSDAILALKPVTFHYKSDSTNTPQFGLIAEDVAAVNPALVVRNADGQIYTVRYDAVNAMLLNEFLKEHQTVKALKSTVEKQEAIIAQQQKGMETLVATVKVQAAQIQKVSAQLELNARTPQTVVNK
jgi:trimeric autotransporter adhesin